MIVAAKNQGPAVLACAGDVGVSKNVAGAIHARPFAIPDADHAIDIRLIHHVDDLASHHRCCRQIFIHSGDEMDIMFREHLAGARERHIVSAKWRAFVAGNKDAAFEAGATVAPHLIQRQAHQRLNAG